MPDSLAPGDRRASFVCLVGFVAQAAVLLVATIVLTYKTNSEAIAAEIPHMIAGALIWWILWGIFAQRRRARLEQFETEELRRARTASATGALFDEGEELLIQRRRLQWRIRWVLPVAAVALALGHIAIFANWYFTRRPELLSKPWPKVEYPHIAMFAVAAIGFVCFLYSRYTLGMAKSPQWKMLRAGGSYMMGNALVCLAIVVAMGCQAYRENLPQVEMIVTYGIRFLMLLLGLEFLINLILDFYRPKLAGEDPTPAFDSRILALISDPTGIARNIAEAVNYQFGFEVTSTWFYQLLKRWLVPLTVFTILALFALSTVVVVDADQQAFIEHFGRAPAADATPLAPGLHFKWPWPFDALRRESVHEIHEIVIGTHKDEKDEHADAPILWTEKHEFVPETMLMLATPESVQDVASPLVRGAPGTRPDATESSAASERGKAVGVSLLMVSIPIEYRIKKLHDYLYRYQNPEAVMEAIAFRTLTEFGAGQDIYGLMGPDRAKFNTRLRDQIQQEFDHWKLGVEITFLGLQDAHPPPDSDVAKTFQSVITAEQQKEATIRTASGLAESMLTEAAGSTQRAAILDEAIQRMNTLQADANADPPAVSAALQRVDELLLGSIVRGIAPVSGSAAKLINDARAQQIKLVSEKESDAAVFANQLVAYKAAPDVYLMRQYLDMLGSALQRIRKYVVTTDRKASKLTIILEAEQGLGAPLPDVDKSQPHP